MNHSAGQRGMTLVEVIIAGAISALLVAGITAAYYLIVRTTERTNEEAGVMHDLQNAGRWINSDAQMAAGTDLVDGAAPVGSATLEWNDAYGVSHSAVYGLSGAELVRTYDGVPRTVAWHVSSVGFSIATDVLTFHIESTSDGRWHISRESTGKVALRQGAP